MLSRATASIGPMLPGVIDSKRSDCGFAVDLGMMAVAYCTLVASQPNATDREAAISAAFRNARFLEQIDGISTGANEDEFGRHCIALSRVYVLDTHPPYAVMLTIQIHDTMFVVH